MYENKVANTLKITGIVSAGLMLLGGIVIATQVKVLGFFVFLVCVCVTMIVNSRPYIRRRGELVT